MKNPIQTVKLHNRRVANAMARINNYQTDNHVHAVNHEVEVMNLNKRCGNRHLIGFAGSVAVGITASIAIPTTITAFAVALTSGAAIGLGTAVLNQLDTIKTADAIEAFGK